MQNVIKTTRLTGHDRQIQVIRVEVVDVGRDELVDELRVRVPTGTAYQRSFWFVDTAEGADETHGYHDPSDVHKPAHDGQRPEAGRRSEGSFSGRRRISLLMYG